MDALWTAISTRLGLRDGRALVPAADDGGRGAPSIVDTGDPDRRYLVVSLADPEDTGPGLRWLRMQVAVDGREIRAMREYRSLLSDRLPDRCVVRPDRSATRPPSIPDVLPPLYYCRPMRLWIAATCTSHHGTPGSPDGAACAACGQSDRGGCRHRSPLESIWNGVQASLAGRGGATGPGAGFPAPACLTCDRRQNCYPASGSPTDPIGAREALVEVQPRPWIGTVVGVAHVPLGEWFHRIGGQPPGSSADAERIPKALARARAGGRGPDRLVPEEFRSRGVAEDLLLRLEAFRQMTAAALGLVGAFGIDDLGLGPEHVWFRLPESVGAIPASWATQATLLDVAPTDDGGPTRTVAPWRAPSQGGVHPKFSGVLIPSGETASQDGREGLKYLFIPDEECADPPAAGAAIEVGPEGGDRLEGFLENAFSDVFRVVVYLEGRNPDALTEALTGSTDPVTVQIGRGGDGRIDPDLYALGSIWIAMLRRGVWAPARAAEARERMLAELLRAGIDRHDHTGAARTCARLGVESGEFAVYPRIGVDVVHSSEGALLGRCLWLGLRMAGEQPGDSPEITRTALENHLREIEILREEARLLMLGRPTADEEILTALEVWEARNVRA